MLLGPIIWGNAGLQSDHVFITRFSELLITGVPEHSNCLVLTSHDPPYQCPLIPHSPLMAVKSMSYKVNTARVALPPLAQGLCASFLTSLTQLPLLDNGGTNET